jgi:hypothetical protein
VTKPLTDAIADLVAAATGLGKALHPRAAANLADLVRIANTYYSNLIEGHNIRPRDMERALARELLRTRNAATCRSTPPPTCACRPRSTAQSRKESSANRQRSRSCVARIVDEDRSRSHCRPLRPWASVRTTLIIRISYSHQLPNVIRQHV